MIKTFQEISDHMTCGNDVISVHIMYCVAVLLHMHYAAYYNTTVNFARKRNDLLRMRIRSVRAWSINCSMIRDL